ncbi:GNAT family N-acetyltransferase [Janibacter melonis]|uniref:GNAT family N-acetyltransferase n=1 Tax=Janibacter melonis TaxID=262209 RepID=UPI002094222B|nr:GNAT family N-acetyltransferase [Janibacter melonis]
MTAAMRLGAAWAFEQGAPSLYWHANVGNWGSRRVAWRVGMTEHGTLPGASPVATGR